MNGKAIVEEAARLVCEEQLIDYRAAKLKALDRLGLPARTPLPDNASVHAAVLDYLRLFGGDEYRQRLRAVRRIAPRLMRLLADFTPRMVGATVNGALTAAHRLQLHAFADQAELLDVFLMDQQLDFDAGERRFRYASGQEEAVPVSSFDYAGIGVDVAVFGYDDLRRLPLSAHDGRPYQRLDLAAAEQLAVRDP